MAYSDKPMLRDSNGHFIPQFFDFVDNAYKPLGDVKDVILQDTVISTGNGTVFTVGSYKTLTIEITGTSTSRTIIFEGSSISGAYYLMQGVKLSDLSMATQTTGKDEVWQFDVTGLVNFRARISTVAGGNVSVNGKAVA